MTPAEAIRAAILAEALADMTRLETAPLEDRRSSREAIKVVAGCWDLEGDGEHIATVMLDAVTSALLLPLLRDLITTELKKLGVEP